MHNVIPLLMPTRKCGICKEIRVISEFTKYDGCKPCKNKKSKAAYEANKEKKLKQNKAWKQKNRDWWKSPEQRKKHRINRLKRCYNITEDDYNVMYNKQNGCCFICGLHQKELNSGLCVDHCHKTSKIRGLLCRPCNSAVGLVKEDISIINKMIEYLTLHGR